MNCCSDNVAVVNTTKTSSIWNSIFLTPTFEWKRIETNEKENSFDNREWTNFYMNAERKFVIEVISLSDEFSVTCMDWKIFGLIWFLLRYVGLNNKLVATTITTTSTTASTSTSSTECNKKWKELTKCNRTLCLSMNDLIQSTIERKMQSLLNC